MRIYLFLIIFTCTGVLLGCTETKRTPELSGYSRPTQAAPPGGALESNALYNSSRMLPATSSN